MSTTAAVVYPTMGYGTDPYVFYTEQLQKQSYRVRSARRPQEETPLCQQQRPSSIRRWATGQTPTCSTPSNCRSSLIESGAQGDRRKKPLYVNNSGRRLSDDGLRDRPLRVLHRAIAEAVL